MGHKVFVILHDIRSAENVGSIFRTADAAGVARIYLTGYTPAPLDRFRRKNAKLSKAALGAEDTVPWESEPDIFACIENLKKSGVRVIAVEQHPRARSYTDAKSEGPIACVFGNEVDGVPKEVIEECDDVIEVPMFGTKESLNVAVCAGIILFNTRRAENG